MKRKIKEIEQPEWFELARYEQLSGLTNDELFFEAVIRAGIYNQVINSKSSDVLNDAMSVLESNQILIYGAYLVARKQATLPASQEHAPFASRWRAMEEDIPIRPVDYSSAPMIPMTAAAVPMTGMMLKALLIESLKAGVIKPILNRPGEFVMEQKYDLLSVAELTNNPRLDILIDLVNATDKEILAELGVLLPMWRKHLCRPEPDKRRENQENKTASSVITRIIEYKTIQMLDLKLWCHHKGIEEYSVPELNRILFNNGTGKDVQDYQLSQTRIPFIEDLLSSNYQDMCLPWLNRTGGDGKVNGKRLVRDELLYQQARKKLK